jgi:hypothetical protein
MMATRIGDSRVPVNLRSGRAWPAFLLLLLALLGAQPALADVFTVRVRAEAEGANADEAKAKAVQAAQVEAWQRLLRRIVVDEDLAGAPPMTVAEIQPLLASMEVVNETLKKKKYSGELAFKFNPDTVRSYLSGRGLRFTETPARPVVVLPVLGEGEAAVLWQDPNPWRLAWANHWGSDGLVPLVVPLGELEDVAAADAPEALAGDAKALASLAGRYGTGDSLVAQALVTGDPAKGGAALTVKATGYGAVASQPFSLTFQQAAKEAEGAFYARAVEAVAARLESDWKRANAFYYGTQSSLPVTVVIGALQDWLLARQVLEGSPLVVNLQVLSLSRSAASIVVNHRGTVEQLALWLAQQDLVLRQGVGGWELRVGATAGAVDQKPLGTN